jgi:hypothetical protein
MTMTETMQSPEYELERTKEKIERVKIYCDLVLSESIEAETKIAVGLIKTELEKINTKEK